MASKSIPRLTQRRDFFIACLRKFECLSWFLYWTIIKSYGSKRLRVSASLQHGQIGHKFAFILTSQATPKSANEAISGIAGTQPIYRYNDINTYPRKGR